MHSSTRWARRARSSSVTGRPWQALRTPARTLPRLNGSLAPERLVTVRLAVSIVVKRRPHSGHWRRRRMELPSSVVRESMTRESVCRQNGQRSEEHTSELQSHVNLVCRLLLEKKKKKKKNIACC